MKNEDFVTFEQAVKLKELGFDWDCDFIYYLTYHNHDKPIFSRYETTRDYEMEKYWDVPTLSQVQKWLRDVKRTIIAVIPKYEMQCDGTYAWEYWYEIYNSIGKRLYAETASTYEYALELAIDNTLKLLKEEQYGRLCFI